MNVIYGALQGYNKDIAFEELNIDQELVMKCVGVMQRVLLAWMMIIPIGMVMIEGIVNYQMNN